MSSKSIFATMGRNLLVIALAYAVLLLAARIGEALGPAPVHDVAALLGVAAGLWIAFRLKATVAAVVLATIGVTFAVEFLYHAIFGYQTVQTGPVHMAVLTASFVGLIVGAISFPRRVQGATNA